jgi:DNA-binding GntR family transcriptional regulator
MKTVRIEKTTLREKVYDTLRGMIIAGEILPGRTLTLRDLSEKFGVSVVPVREALFQMEAERVIVRRNNRDYRVNTLSAAQLDEIYGIRRILETHIGELACRKRPREAVADVENALRSMKKHVGSVKRYVFFNQKFHFGIYSCSEQPILLEIISGLWARIGPYLSINMKTEDSQKTYKFHTGMFEAFKKGDPKLFSKFLVEDTRYSYRYLRPYIAD